MTEQKKLPPEHQNITLGRSYLVDIDIFHKILL